MKESYPPGHLQAGRALRDRQRGRRFGLCRWPGAWPREEGIFVGMSAGAAMKVAIDEAQALGKGTVVALLPDGGERYLSTSLFVSETLPEPLRFYNTLAGKAGATRTGLAGQGHACIPAGRAWMGRPTWDSAVGSSSPTCCDAISNAAAIRSSTP